MRFTVRRPPTGEVSPCCHRPSGGDVTCSVDVGVAPASIAGLTLENRLALAVPGCDVPARRASLRRVRGRNLLDPTNSLLLQTRGQEPPTAAADGAVQPALLRNAHSRLLHRSSRRAGHRLHVKSLDFDHVEPPSEVGGGLLDPVFAAIPVAGLEPCDRPSRFTAPVGVPLGAGESLLEYLQPLRFTPGHSGCVQQFTRRQRGRHDDAAIDTDHAGIARTGDWIGDVGERDVPAASPITGDPVGPDAAWHRPRQAEAHPPDLRHPHPPESAVQPFDVVQFQSNLSKPFVYAGLAPRRPTMRTAEKVLHGLCEVPQRLLLHCLTTGTKPPKRNACVGQLRSLFNIAGRLQSGSPVLLLLHCQIPHISRIPAMRQQCPLLLGRGQQPKPRHMRTITIPTDNYARSTPAHDRRGFLPLAADGDSHDSW